MIRTLTLRRPDQDITVEFVKIASSWVEVASLDEDGRSVELSTDELDSLYRMIELGHDETGV